MQSMHDMLYVKYVQDYAKIMQILGMMCRIFAKCIIRTT